MHCVNDLSGRDLSQDETICVEKCAYKHVKMNNRAMQVYMEVQPKMTEKRIEEMKQQAEQQRIKMEEEQQKAAAEFEVAQPLSVDDVPAKTEQSIDS